MVLLCKNIAVSIASIVCKDKLNANVSNVQEYKVLTLMHQDENRRNEIQLQKMA